MSETIPYFSRAEGGLVMKSDGLNPVSDWNGVKSAFEDSGPLFHPAGINPELLFEVAVRHHPLRDVAAGRDHLHAQQCVCTRMWSKHAGRFPFADIRGFLDGNCCRIRQFYRSERRSGNVHLRGNLMHHSTTL